jgi:hypothetical protein
MNTHQVQQSIEQLSSAVTTNGQAIIQILSIIEHQDEKINELKLEILYLKSQIK